MNPHTDIGAWVAERPLPHRLDFAALKRRLIAPPQRRLTVAALIENLHPHTLPFGESAPQDWHEVRRSLQRFPDRQRVICAAIAAQMALPIWETADIEPPLRFSLGPTIDCAFRWANGDANTVELRTQSEWALSTGRAVNGPTQQAAFAASYAAFTYEMAMQQAREAGYPTDSPAFKLAATQLYQRAAIHAVKAAYLALAPVYMFATRQAFLVRWWARCVARLPIVDAFTATFECESASVN